MAALLSASEFQLLEQALQSFGCAYDDVVRRGSAWSLLAGGGGSSAGATRSAPVPHPSMLGGGTVQVTLEVVEGQLLSLRFDVNSLLTTT